MRFTRKICFSVLTAATALGAAPALAAADAPPPPGPRQIVWDQPCPPGQFLTWVEHPGTPPRIYIDELGRIKFIPGEPPFSGYECQSYKLVGFPTHP